MKTAERFERGPRGAGELRERSCGTGIARLERCDVPSAPLAAELLLMHVLERDRAWLYAHPEYELSSGQRLPATTDLIERRSAGVPTQYLTGHQEFWGLEFEVGPGVLIPRPETEHVIEVALARLGARRTDSLRIADVGTGSGCIAVALARELPHAEIVATDISARGPRLCAKKCRAPRRIRSNPILRGESARNCRGASGAAVKRVSI